ncbi:MAG: DUF6483 family protein [bacterium]
MLQRDYFMKMTEMLTSVLTKVLFYKEKKNYEDAEKEIETAAKTIVGLDLKIISILNTEELISLMKTSDVYAGRCLISAELLKEYGDIIGEKGNAKLSITVYIKSLCLYIESILSKELPSPEKYYTRVDFLIKHVAQFDKSLELKFRIIEYYELSGQYSKAEDVLFELIDNNAESIHDKAVAFYKRIQLKTDEDLIKGNLCREEVEESLEEILNLKNDYLNN